MKYTVAFTLVAFFVGFPVAVSAQQEAVQSFEALRTRLRAGDRIIVRDAEGRTTRGLVRLPARAGCAPWLYRRRWY